MADAITEAAANAAIISAQNQAAALAKWDKVADRTAATQAMRDGFKAKLREAARADMVAAGLDPDKDVAELADRIERKLRLHYAKMRASSLKTRQANAAAKRQAAVDALAQAVVEASPDEAA